MLEAALEYARLGFPVFPCATGRKTPATANGVKDATTDEARIRVWWEASPAANIGLHCAGLCVVDVDGAEHPFAGRLADGSGYSLARTPRGGWHYFYRKPAGLFVGNWVGRLEDKVDTRSDGGYVLVYPSLVEDQAYE